MWQILNVEPTYGVCSICRSHECGIVDGKHQWIHCEALDDSGENIVIGYKCVKLFSENLGITKEFVDRIVWQPPTDEQILNTIKEAMNKPGKLGLPHEPFKPILDTSLDPSDIAEHQDEQKVKTHPRSKVKATK